MYVCFVCPGHDCKQCSKSTIHVHIHKYAHARATYMHKTNTHTYTHREAQGSSKHFLIEAITANIDNVKIHRDLGALSASAVRNTLNSTLPLSWTWHGDPSHPPILLIHGFLGCKEDWDPIVSQLTKSRHSCICVDLPGHGDSVPVGRRSTGALNSGHMAYDDCSEIPGHAPQRDYFELDHVAESELHDKGYIPSVVLSQEYAVSAIAQLLASLGLVKCAVAGYSMGGRLAMRLLADHPDLVSAACIISAHPGEEDARARSERYAADRRQSDELQQVALARGDADAHGYACPQHDTQRVSRGMIIDHNQREAGVLSQPRPEELEQAKSHARSHAQDAPTWAVWLDKWYSLSLFGDIRAKSCYSSMLKRRVLKSRPEYMSDVVLGHSLARQPSLWRCLSSPRGVPVMYIAGEKDAKYAGIAAKLAGMTPANSSSESNVCSYVKTCVIEGASHALIEEAPETVASRLADFFGAVNCPSSSEDGTLKKGVADVSAQAAACANNTSGSIEMNGTLSTFEAQLETLKIMIASVNVKRFSLDLTGPLKLSKGDALVSREGLLIEVCAMAGHVGYGECTPLPGFHQDTLDEVEAQLKEAAKLLVGRIVPASLARLDGRFDQWLSADANVIERFAQWHFDVPASSTAGAAVGASSLVKSGDDGRVRDLVIDSVSVPTASKKLGYSACVVCALEMAVMNLIAHVVGLPLSVMLSKTTGSPLSSHVNLNGLATRNESGELCVNSGFPVWKIKVGGSDGVENDAKRVRASAVQARAHGVMLRLDANQAWTYGDAVRFAELLGEDARGAVEYIEEPLQDVALLDKFAEVSGMRYALDESIDQGKFGSILAGATGGLAAIVVKPSILGGLERCRAVAQLIRDRDVEVRTNRMYVCLYVNTFFIRMHKCHVYKR
jgi:pimeloyl-ACP methyl ester carboxylesterase/L-alanine-DL-glutamate epimerase-like enolase superfamily enzyme